MVQASSHSAGRGKFRPDMVVRCGPSGNRTFMTDPIIIVEVLSPSTFDRDRGPKLEFYKGLPTVQHIVLAYADQMRLSTMSGSRRVGTCRCCRRRRAFSTWIRCSFR